jgi:hypothetical protein
MLHQGIMHDAQSLLGTPSWATPREADVRGDRDPPARVHYREWVPLYPDGPALDTRVHLVTLDVSGEPHRAAAEYRRMLDRACVGT